MIEDPENIFEIIEMDPGYFVPGHRRYLCNASIVVFGLYSKKCGTILEYTPKTRKIVFPRLLKLPQNQNFFLFGPRNTGKSTLIQQNFPDALSIDLLDPEEEERFLRNPNTLKYEVLATTKTHIVIDEIQKVPKLLDVVHYLIETTQKYFVLTGSSARKLKRGGANLLAGRAFVYHLFPLCAFELGNTFDLNTAITWGGLPKIFHHQTDEERTEFLKAYAHTYLKEEIWSEHIIRKLDPFQKFLEIAAQMNGRIINTHKIAQDVGVDDKTINQYFEILEDTMIGFLLHGFKHSARKRLSEKPKFYFFDTGVKRALARQLSLPIMPSTYDYGDAFEHFIILECQKLASYHRKDFQFNYFMKKDGVEIDLVVARPGLPLLFIEIKSKTDVQERDIKELAAIRSSFPDAEFACFSQDKRAKIINGISVLPWQEGLERYCRTS